MIWQPLDALGESDDSPSPDQIEAYAGIRIPPSARDVRARLDQVLTKRTIFVRLSLDAAELDAFLHDASFDALLSPVDVPALLTSEPRPEWFAPERAEHFLAGAGARSAVLVDTSAEQPVVYVVARS